MTKKALFSGLPPVCGDIKPFGGTLSYHAQPGMRELADIRRNKAAASSYHAAYIGCVIYVLRKHGGISANSLQATLGIKNGRALSVMTNTLPRCGSPGLAPMIALLKEHAPDLYAHPGLGNVLEAYRDGRPASALYADDIMAIAGNRDTDLKTRQDALLKLFPPPPREATVPARKIRAQQEKTRLITLDELLPLEPDTVYDAIAQENILQDPENHRFWTQSSFSRRMGLIEKRAGALRLSIRYGQLDPQNGLAKKFNAAARGLLAIEAKLTGMETPAHMPTLIALKTALQKEPESDAERVVHRRMSHMIRFAPQSTHSTP